MDNAPQPAGAPERLSLSGAIVACFIAVIITFSYVAVRIFDWVFKTDLAREACFPPREPTEDT